MYRFEFLSKKDCFKLKLIAPELDFGIAAHDIRLAKHRVFFFLLLSHHIHALTRARSVLFTFGERKQSWVFMAGMKTAMAKTRCIAHSCEHTENDRMERNTTFGHISFLWLMVMFSVHQNARTPYIHSVLNFMLPRLAAAIAENSVSLSLRCTFIFFALEIYYRLQFNVCIRSSHFIVRFIAFAHCTRKSMQRIASMWNCSYSNNSFSVGNV